MPVFSRDLEETLRRAVAIARERHTPATTLHLALALTENVFVGDLLQACAVDPAPLKARLRLMAGPAVADASRYAGRSSDASFDAAVHRATLVAQAHGRTHGSPHMLLALLDQPGDPISDLLRDAGVTRYDITRRISHGLRKRGAHLPVDAPYDPRAPFDVLLLNDDFTPMAFVTSMLRDVFDRPEADAIRITRDVHRTGFAAGGTYPHETATAKMAVVAKLAREQQHPLHCVLKPREV